MFGGAWGSGGCLRHLYFRQQYFQQKVGDGGGAAARGDGQYDSGPAGWGQLTKTSSVGPFAFNSVNGPMPDDINFLESASSLGLYIHVSMGRNSFFANCPAWNSLFVIFAIDM